MFSFLGKVRGSFAGAEAPDWRYRAAPEVKASLHSDGVVLIHPGNGTVYSANRVGAMVWQGAAAHQGMDQVTARISEAFDISGVIARRDAAAFVAQLETAGLLVLD